MHGSKWAATSTKLKAQSCCLSVPNRSPPRCRQRRQRRYQPHRSLLLWLAVDFGVQEMHFWKGTTVSRFLLPLGYRIFFSFCNQCSFLCRHSSIPFFFFNFQLPRTFPNKALHTLIRKEQICWLNFNGICSWRQTHSAKYKSAVLGRSEGAEEACGMGKVERRSH